MPGFPTTFPSSGPHWQEISDVLSLQRKANQRPSGSMPNSSVPTRRLRRLGPAKYLRRQLRPSRQHALHPRRPPTTLRHLLTKLSLRTARIASAGKTPFCPVAHSVRRKHRRKVGAQLFFEVALRRNRSLPQDMVLVCPYVLVPKDTKESDVGLKGQVCRRYGSIQTAATTP